MSKWGREGGHSHYFTKCTGKGGKGGREGAGDLPNTHWIQKCVCSTFKESRTDESGLEAKAGESLAQVGQCFQFSYQEHMSNCLPRADEYQERGKHKAC